MGLLELRNLVLVVFIATLTAGCGDRGPTSVDGVDYWEAFERKDVDVGERVDLHARCPADSVLVGGGYILAPPPGDFLGADEGGLNGAPQVEASYPSDPLTWSLRVRGAETDAQSALAVTVRAVCARPTLNQVNESVVAQSDQQSLSPVGLTIFSEAEATAQCPAGTTRTAGGFLLDGYSADPGTSFQNGGVASSAPSGTAGWSVRAEIAGDRDETVSVAVRAYALCASPGVADDTDVVDESATELDSQLVDEALTCGERRIPTGGGFTATGSSEARLAAGFFVYRAIVKSCG